MLDLTADSAIFVGDFGETVRFRASNSARARTITANVNRQPIADDPEAPFAGHRPPVIHIMVRNSSVGGVQPSEVDEENSAVEVEYPLGATPRWRNVTRIVRHNAGCMILEVQA